MAEDRDDIDYEDDEDENSGFFRWLQMAVVVFALGGFFGLAWYAYKSGDNVDEKDVELIKTDKTPVKEAPADPGGMQIPNQDKTVYSLINGNKAEKPVVERILPPTEEPIQHGTDTETWMNEKIKAKSTSGADTQKPSQPKETAQIIPKQKEPKDQVQPKEENTGAASQPVLPHDNTEVPQNTSQPVAVMETKKQVPNDPQPVKPAAQEPVKQAVQTEEQPQEEEPEKPKTAPAPQKLPKVRIQLGAFKSEAEARKEWGKISKKFSDELDGKQNYVVHVVVKGKNFYRLQAAPFSSAKAAEELCMTLVSSNQGCFLAKDK